MYMWSKLAAVLVFCATTTSAAPKLIAMQPTEFKRWANVTVSWQDIDITRHDVWISAWSPPDFPLPVKLSPTGQGANGTTTFRLLNIRHPIVFKLTDGDPTSSSALVLAESNSIAPEQLPMQVRTSLTSRHGELQVMFIDNSTETPMVHWGTSAVNLSHSVAGSTTTYTLDDVKACNTSDQTAIKRFFDPGAIHTVMISIPCGVPIFYSTSHGSTFKAGDQVFRHVGIKCRSKNSGPTRILYVADMGAGPARRDELNGALDSAGSSISRENAGPRSGGRLVVESILDQEAASLQDYAAVLHNGDLSYGCGEAWLHEQWGTLVEPLASAIPYQVTLGNHEYDHLSSPWPTASDRAGWAKSAYSDDSGGDCGLTYLKRFQMPTGTSSVADTPISSTPKTDLVPYYSVDIGLVHVAVITVEIDFTNSSAQHAWLQNDLKAVNRSATPWVIVCVHRQVYFGGRVTSGLLGRVQSDLEPVFIAGKVDLVLSAHAHTYMRMCSLQNGVCDSSNKSPVYIVDGTAGAYTGDASTGEGYSCKQPIGPFPAPVLAKDCQWGWSRLEANDQELRWEHVRWNSGVVADSVVLNRKT